MARFAQYAMVASQEALKDAEWVPEKEEDLEATVGQSKLCLCESRANNRQGVYMGSGIGSMDDVYDTTVAFSEGVRLFHTLTLNY